MKIIYKIHFLPLLFLTTVLVNCVHVELPHHGEVKDAETGEPLEGALVFLSLYSQCIWPLPHVGSDYSGSIETLTDKNGQYRLPLDSTINLPMCFTNSKDYTFLKPNYFEERFTQYSSWYTLGSGYLGEEYKHDPKHIYLYKMKHYLNYLPYKYPHKYNFPSYHIEEDSKYYKTYVESINKLNLTPADEYGVFLRLPGKKLTRVYSKINKSSKSYYESIVNYVYDEVANEWVAIDGSGNVLEQKISKLPKWNFMSSNEVWGYPIYADNNKIFYPVEENMIPAGMRYDKGEIKFISSHKGNISALAGTLEHFFTIEDNGLSICEYARDWKKGGEFLPYLLNCFTGKDLPSSKEDDSFSDSKFMYLNDTLNHGLFVVTKTPKYWHVYSFMESYDEKVKEVRLFIKEMFSLTADREITAFMAPGNSFYIAFKGDGIRKYDIIVPLNVTGKEKPYVKEDHDFFINSRQIKYSTIKSLTIGYAVNIQALYAVTGENMIYRFSLDGIPDYQIKIK